MKYITSLLTLLLFVALQVSARNDVETIEQVTTPVVITDAVDYVITSTEPFSDEGSVDIQATDHGVLIFRNVKPSKVISSWLKYVTINGNKARNNTNCQVRMYAQGAIVFPYSSTVRPLTCYTEPNFEGESVNAYSQSSSGGYMNTLTTKNLLNKIRSFKLKRGYMVTFAVGTSGWGYSRCFIAAQEDLEIVAMPHVLDGKVSSFRIFQWYNAQKKGLASNGDKTTNSALNTSWCYDWAQGNANNLPDTEWVPNHIYEDYPSSATCGSVTGSCHMKTNNEPRNSSDDHPQDLETILNNWQNLMRTGMRLCSPSSWDGSDYWNGTGFIKDFLTEIDARGWRCDIVDAHCYWNEYNFTYLQSQWWPSMKRPIWISEWIWGASWNNNGCFGSGVTDAQILSTTKNILNTLNNSGAVERYAYWNGESKGHIYENGSLTQLGEYYDSMETGLGYNPAYEFVPTVVISKPATPTGKYTKSTKKYTLTWKDPNGDMVDSIIVEVKYPDESTWRRCGSLTPKDKTSSADLTYTFTDDIPGPGLYTYRIVDYYEKTKYISEELSFALMSAEAVGLVQYGTLQTANDEALQITFSTSYDAVPYVVVGMGSNKNTSNGITNQLTTATRDAFSFRFLPWQYTTPITFKNIESASYLALPRDTILHLTPSMTVISATAGTVKGDEVTVTFPEPFPDDVVPVVIAQQQANSSSPVTVRVYNVTPTGFCVKLTRQEKVTTTFSGQTVNYFAATPGQASIGGGKLLTVGLNTERPVGGVARQDVALTTTLGDTLHLLSPYIVAAPQTDRYPEKASVFRQNNLLQDEQGYVWGINIRRQVDPSATSTATNNANANGDHIGFFVVSDDPNATGDEPPVVIPTAIRSLPSDAFQSASPLTYDLSGRRVPNVRGTRSKEQGAGSKEQGAKGIYIRNGKRYLAK